MKNTGLTFKPIFFAAGLLKIVPRICAQFLPVCMLFNLNQSELC